MSDDLNKLAKKLDDAIIDAKFADFPEEVDGGLRAAMKEACKYLKELEECLPDLVSRIKGAVGEDTLSVFSLDTWKFGSNDTLKEFESPQAFHKFLKAVKSAVVTVNGIEEERIDRAFRAAESAFAQFSRQKFDPAELIAELEKLEYIFCNPPPPPGGMPKRPSKGPKSPGGVLKAAVMVIGAIAGLLTAASPYFNHDKPGVTKPEPPPVVQPYTYPGVTLALAALLMLNQFLRDNQGLVAECKAAVLLGQQTFSNAGGMPV